MYVELGIALFIMLIVLILVIVFAEKIVFPLLEARDERKELEHARHSVKVPIEDKDSI